MASSSVFAGIQQGPEDPILGVTVAFNKDPSPVKVNLGVGAYRTEEGKPLVLNVVRRAEAMLIHNESRVKEYLPITGLAEFNKLSAKLIFGADRCVCSTSTFNCWYFHANPSYQRVNLSDYSTSPFLGIVLLSRRIGWLLCSAYQGLVLYGWEVNFLQDTIMK
jgi:hypothetical protein